MNRQFAAPVPAGEIGAILARELAGAQCAFLFGSSETRSFAEESDVDVAVLLPSTLDLSARLALKGSLETMLGRDVDLVDLRGADPILAFQVLRLGRPIVMRDPKAYEAFVMRTLSEYADLRLDRRPVERALRREGAPCVTVQLDADVVMAKAATVRRCIEAIRKVGKADPPLQEWMAQDLYVLNLQRAVQGCLDLAHHLIGANRWDLPRSAAQAMEIIAREGVIPQASCATMVAMVGFRNIAVDEYAALDPAIVRAIVDKHLPDLEAFTARVLDLLPAQGA